jgi:hypothetical protein
MEIEEGKWKKVPTNLRFDLTPFIHVELTDSLSLEFPAQTFQHP